MTKKKAVTTWFDGDQKPVHSGWYQRNYQRKYQRNIGRMRFAYWFFDGSDWRIGGCSRPADNVHTKLSPDQTLPWRGLAEKP